MTRATVTWTVVAGIALGAAYAASPMTVWFGLAMIVLFALLGRGLPEAERRSLWTVMAIAIGLRLLAIAVLFLASDPSNVTSFFWDGDGVYLKQRSIWIRDVWLGVPLMPREFTIAFGAYGWTTYLYVLAYLQYLLGVAPYGVHLLNVALFVASAGMIYRLVRVSYGHHAALLGFMLMLFLPTPFFWSVSALKESLYLFLAVVALFAAVTALRPRPLLVRAIAVAVLIGAIALVAGVRTGARLITVLGLTAGLAGSVVVRRVTLVLLVLVLLPFVATRAWSNAGVQTRVMTQMRTSATTHLGGVRTLGHGYRLLDQRFYFFGNEMLASMTPVEALRFSLRAMSTVILVPLPWQVNSASEIVILPQQVVWYLLVPFAVVGLIAGIRRDAVVTCMLAGLTAAGLAVVALNSGNIGTMVRHRDTVVPFVVWLSALGVVATLSRLMARTQGKERHVFD